MERETLASFIQDRRQALGIKQGELADAIGITAAYMSQIESGKTKWPHQSIPGLARALGVSQVRLAVAAGLIEPSALEESGTSMANPFPADDPRWRLVETLKGHTLTDQQAKAIAGIVTLMTEKVGDD